MGPCGRRSAAAASRVCGVALDCLLGWQLRSVRLSANRTVDAIPTRWHTGRITRTTTVALMNKAARGAFIMVRVRAFALVSVIREHAD